MLCYVRKQPEEPGAGWEDLLAVLQTHRAAGTNWCRGWTFVRPWF